MTLPKHLLTTIFGIVAAVGGYLANAAPTGLEHTIGGLMQQIGTLLLGIFAADSKDTASK